jgi:Putative beta-barrel porin 2
MPLDRPPATSRPGIRSISIRSSSLAISAVLLCASAVQVARAQVNPFGNPSGSQLEKPLASGGRGDITARGGRAENALPVGEWLLYPAAFAGAIYDTNVQQTANAVGSAGLRLVPSILAERNDGVSKTSLYGMADARIYTNPNVDDAGALAARVGLIEDYQLLPDWLFHAQVDYTRQRDLFSTLGISPSVAIQNPTAVSQTLSAVNPTGVGLTPVANPLAYNQFSGMASARKNFADTFVDVGGSVVGIAYDNSSAAAPSPNGVVYTGVGRGGVWLTPDVYGFVEVSGDSRNYATSALSSSGYQMLAGIGSNRIGLLRGQIYGGYQAENYSSAAIGTVSSSVFGGQVYYYPLRELTLSLAVDRTIGASLLAPTAALPAGTATLVTDALVQATYALAPEWTANGRGGYIRTDYIGSIRRDNAWTLGMTVSYSIWRSFGLTLDYQHVELASNVPLAGFSRDVVSVGLTYKY